MNITALQTFLAIVDTGSLVRASQVLHVTQSTVTARLKTLEDELGQQLLNRQKSGTTLTPAGTRLLRYARIMTGLWRQAQHETSLPAGLASVCTLGCDRELWHGPGRNFFNGLISGNPEMAVSVLQGSGRDLEEWLATGVVDVILTFDTLTRGNQTVHALPPEELVLYSDDPKTPIDAGSFYIFVDHGEEFRRQHAETYYGAGVARVSFDSSWWALQTMLDRGGSAYLPRSLAAPYVDDGLLHQLDAPIYTRKKNLIVNDASAQNWTWFTPLVAVLRTAASG
ncbi:LysR family transcriptional regulator [Roseovarius indicus]|uniref:LysR family transcriptional regulator n=1 Tax=Roseovarius indicus TaxID=540747 RepID=UPI0007DA14DE|nr:LysR family transcriptional regulator [Roseovarius indicus]OAO06446.1 LysR family transcriptional regulator [Roseovarius indicus]